MYPSTLLALDGSGMIRRLYETNREPDSQEKVVGVLHDTVTLVTRQLSLHKPTHVLPVFDDDGHTFRHDLYPDYRKNRSPMPSSMRSRIPALVKRLAALGMHAVAVPGVDANDVIATAVTRWLTEANGPVVIVSTEKELLPLLDYGATVWDCFKNEWRDHAWVMNRYGVEPDQIVDLIALMGDTGDNIPGVTGIGEKTAARLLQTHVTLEGIMAGPGILIDTLGKRLRSERQFALLSRQLASVRKDVKIGVTWKMLAYTAKSEMAMN